MTNPYNGGSHPENFDSANPGYYQGYGASGGGYHQGYAPQPQLQPGTFDCMRSIEQGWRVFKEKPASWIVGALVFTGISLVLYLVGYIQFIVGMAMNSDPETGDVTSFPFASFGIFMACLVVLMIASLLWTAIGYREASYAVAGKRPEIKDMFTFRRVGIIIVLSIVVGLLEMLGMLALFIGMFVVAFFLMFALPSIVCEDMGIGEAMKSSYTVVKNNVGQSLLLLVLIMVINGIGGSIIIGVLVTQPICFIAMSHAYLTATGRQVQERMA